MTQSRGLNAGVLVLFGLVLNSTPVSTQNAAAVAKLPGPVLKTFEANFPGGQIEKVDSEVEGGVTVYDIEFKDGVTEKETDITAEGVMLEYTVVIDIKSVPPAAMRSIREAAEGATMRRVEEIRISHETKEGKTIKLPGPVTHYAVELKKGDQEAEIVVDTEGRVIEPARFSAGK